MWVIVFGNQNNVSRDFEEKEIAVRSNVGDLEGMKKASLASLSQAVSSKETHLRLAYCPGTSNSLSCVMRDRENGTNRFKHGPGIPIARVGKHLKPIYLDLTSDALLRKSLFGKKQNQNASFKGMV